MNNSIQIKILSAIYGTKEKFADVTEKANTLISDGYFYIGNEFGDPAPYCTKVMKIKYEYKGNQYNDTVPERNIFIPKPFINGIEIYDDSGKSAKFEIEMAKYGAEGWADITEYTRVMFKSQSEYYSFVDLKTGGPTSNDPSPNVQKFYVVKFRYNGKVYISKTEEMNPVMKLLHPTFSVIIPTFNRGKYLKRCINSVLEQDFDLTLVEIVVADDGSTDETQEVMSNICAKNPNNIIYIRIPHSGTPSLPRNVAIAASTGRYIALLDSDDKYFKNHLQVLLEKFNSSEKYLFIRTWTEFAVLKFNDDGTIEEKKEPDFAVVLHKIYNSYPSCWAFRRELLGMISKPPFPMWLAGEDVRFSNKAMEEQGKFGVNQINQTAEIITVQHTLTVNGNNIMFHLDDVAEKYRDRK